MDWGEFDIKAGEFEKSYRNSIKKSWETHKQFLALFPFRKSPDDIELLTPERIYKPGSTEDSFLIWIEFKLKELGRVFAGSALYAENARENPEVFKNMLRIAIDDSMTLAEKVDAHWEDIKGFGGDRLIAKKIIATYYPEAVIPILKNDDFEHFATLLEIDFKKKALSSYGKSYEMLTLGERFELLNSLMLDFKKSREKIKKWDNVLFMRFLYNSYSPERIRPMRREREPLQPLGLLFTPEYEQEVVYLFSVFHRELGFPYIIKLRNEFPDGVVMDENKNAKTIEFEVKASDFIAHKHDKKGCDIIICWENDMESAKDMPTIISLKDFVQKI